MTTAKAKALQLIETELRFISRSANNVETSGHEAIHEISLAINSALRAIHELKLEQEPTGEGIPSGVSYPAAA
jgi:hypothetical protein